MEKSNLLILIVLTLSYLRRIVHSFPSEDFPFHMELADGYDIYWRHNRAKVIFEIQVRTQGWIGFGLSENGRMFKADMVVGWVEENARRGVLHDMHGSTQRSGHVTPSLDLQQDYTLKAYWKRGQRSMLKFERAVETCDRDDVEITDETIRIIWAWGENPIEKLDGINYHGATHRGARSTNLLASHFPRRNLPLDAITLELFNKRAVVPSEHTYYHCHLFQVPDYAQKTHMVAWEPVIEKQNIKYVHHILVYKCDGQVDSSSVNVYHECRHPNMPNDFDKCQGVIMAWGVGGGSFNFPEEVGYPFGGPEDPKYLLLETHFDNPQQIEGIVDNSGLRAILTKRLRKFDAGLLSIGRTVDASLFIPPKMPRYNVVGVCNKGCLEDAFKASNVTHINLFASLLHSHLLGRKMRTRHIRHGQEIGHAGRDELYDFNFQEGRVLYPFVLVKPGDELVLECEYNSSDRTHGTVGGYSSREEMCFNFLMYFPRIKLDFCVSMPKTKLYLKTLCLQIDNNYVVKTAGRYQGMDSDEAWAEASQKESWNEKARAAAQKIDNFASYWIACPYYATDTWYRAGEQGKPSQARRNNQRRRQSDSICPIGKAQRQRDSELTGITLPVAREVDIDIELRELCGDKRGNQIGSILGVVLIALAVLSITGVTTAIFINSRT